MCSSQRQVIDSFDSAVKKLVYRPVVKTADSPTSVMKSQHHVDQVSDTGKELWQSLAQATSEKRTKQTVVSDGSKLSSQNLESVQPIISVSDGSESGDGSCNSCATADKQKMERAAETGAGDAKCAVVVSGGWAGWQTVTEDSSMQMDDESFITTVGPGPLDTNDHMVSGEESFYSVTSDVQHESTAAAEPMSDDDDDVPQTEHGS